MTKEKMLTAGPIFLAVCVSLLTPQPIRGQAAPLDHFDCYYPQSQPAQSVSVMLQDVDPPPGFTSPVPVENITELTLFQFCNPVQKTLNGNVSPITRPLDHLAMYALYPPQPPPYPAPATSTIIVASNQFAPRQLFRVGDPIILAVPTGKNEIAATVPSVVPAIPTDLDHFVCYLTDGIPPGAIVQLRDQFDPPAAFLSRTAQVERPLLFCDAVKKTVTASSGGITVTNPPNPDYHMACYEIRPEPVLSAFLVPIASPPVTVSINNQFVTPPMLLTLTQGSAHILCTPTTVFTVPAPGA
jgi:hypothetical protein